SIVLNIAEGAEKQSDKDFSRFLNISVGSTNEVVACLDCALRDGYISTEEHSECLQSAEKIIRQLKAFLAKVRRDNFRF
ncbi:MAG: four helix bundle protein, partial [Pseudomonadota bacterium]